MRIWENGQRHIELIGKRETMMEEYKKVIDERIARIGPEIGIEWPISGEDGAGGQDAQAL
jgi:hypothetical protein